MSRLLLELLSYPMALETSRHRTTYWGLQSSSGGAHHRDQSYLHTHTVMQFGVIKLIEKESQYYRTCECVINCWCH